MVHSFPSLLSSQRNQNNAKRIETFLVFWFCMLVQNICGKFLAKMVTIICPILVHTPLGNMTLPFLPSRGGVLFPTPGIWAGLMPCFD